MLSPLLYCSENADEATSSPCPTRHTSQIGIDQLTHTAILRRPISLLLAAEVAHSPSPDYLLRLRNQSHRQDAVIWILKVRDYYGFRPATASLAVSYLDRFLSSNELPSCGGEGWPMQLLSVACISVAAKMEETEVPLLLDLQVMEPLFVFHPRTVQRMELLLMSSLNWRMCSVTPFDFVDHFFDAIRRDGSGGPFAGDLYSRASHLILRTYRVMAFLEFRPSTISAASIIRAAEEMGDLSAEDSAVFSALTDELDIDAVKRCRRLMDSFLIDTCPIVQPATRPRSPMGVLDAAACVSFDTNTSEGSEISEPRAKRRRLQLECTESMDPGYENRVP